MDTEKVAFGESFKNAREIVRFLNDYKIKREDIVTVIDRDNQLVLIYYK